MAEGPLEGAEPAWGSHAPGLGAGALVWLARNSILGRGPTRKLVYRALAAAHSGPFDTTLWGAPVRLHPRHNVSERKALLRPDRMDPDEHRLVRAKMSGPGRVMVDVGSNAGLYCLSAALVAGTGSVIIAIEPNTALTRRLVFNIAEATRAGQVDPGVRLSVLNVAISDREGEAVLTGTADEGSRSLAIERGGDGMVVRTRPLTAIVDEAGITSIDVMKIDVEGHEDHVLPPYLAGRDGRPLPRLIIIEHVSLARWQHDCIGLCREVGYEIIATTRNNTVLELIS